MPIAPTDLVPIEQIRAHLRIDEDDASQDSMLLIYARAALGWCLWYCDEPSWTVPADVPEQVSLAMLLLITDFDQHRSAQTEVQLIKNPAAESLLWTCRNMLGPAEEVI